MLTIGLDVHHRSSALCILGPTGQLVKRESIKGHPQRVVDRLKLIDEPFQLCYEASAGYGWLYDQMVTRARRVVVAHPGQLRLIFRSKQKNDRADAEKLAKLLYLDEVPPVYVPSSATRSWRGLIEHRNRCMSERTRAKNGLRALLRTHGIETPQDIGLWTQAGMNWLEDVDFTDDAADLQRDQLVEDIHHHTRRVRRVEKALMQLAQQQPGVTLLMTIPGVGLRTAEAFLAYVDDAGRFNRSKSIGRYFGLVPKQDASGGVSRLGRITKEGPAVVRKMLVEAVWQGIRRSPTIRSYHQRMTHDRPDRRKKALVATAHYLARVMLAMLKSGQAWHEQEQSAQA